MERRRITLAILALGGQGGGVLADWILELAAQNGWRAQGTSVPGVAQRTGSTVYYIEMTPEDGADPILALMPVPGDVDIVLASELMEAGRAMVRGFVTQDRTTLITSTHRIYAISEKSAMGDGILPNGRILEAAGERARRFIGFDMEDAAGRAGTVISSVLFGALAGSGALPFSRIEFEAAIAKSGVAIAASLRGFAAGHEAAGAGLTLVAEGHAGAPEPTTATGRALAARVRALLPPQAWANALHGVARLADYQDAAYASLYLDRLEALLAACPAPALATETARHLALWMSYEDTIRVADLKIRGTRIERVRGEVRARPDQLLDVVEFLHPRLREICDVLPAPIGRVLLHSRPLRRLLAPLFAEGRHVRTTGLGGFLLLRLTAGLRRFRRISLRYQEEQARMETWLAFTASTARDDVPLALEIVACQDLIKGYGDTFDRGFAAFEMMMGHAAKLVGSRDAAERLAAFRASASDDDGGGPISLAASASHGRQARA